MTAEADHESRQSSRFCDDGSLGYSIPTQFALPVFNRHQDSSSIAWHRDGSWRSGQFINMSCRLRVWTRPSFCKMRIQRETETQAVGDAQGRLTGRVAWSKMVCHSQTFWPHIPSIWEWGGRIGKLWEAKRPTCVRVGMLKYEVHTPYHDTTTTITTTAARREFSLCNVQSRFGTVACAAPFSDRLLQQNSKMRGPCDEAYSIHSFSLVLSILRRSGQVVVACAQDACQSCPARQRLDCIGLESVTWVGSKR
ncbi:hypothetical protein F4780DRAFT_167043 [Xylariomycetidae sp. FL0641]|nr:hypothetical protein F4780DRAFT_167043 [Xylariomycetidae sp. FL0641]